MDCQTKGGSFYGQNRNNSEWGEVVKYKNLPSVEQNTVY
jgi:hypothetical protein